MQIIETPWILNKISKSEIIKNIFYFSKKYFIQVSIRLHIFQKRNGNPFYSITDTAWNILDGDDWTTFSRLFISITRSPKRFISSLLFSCLILSYRIMWGEHLSTWKMMMNTINAVLLTRFTANKEHSHQYSTASTATVYSNNLQCDCTVAPDLSIVPDVRLNVRYISKTGRVIESYWQCSFLPLVPFSHIVVHACAYVRLSWG